MKNLVIISGLLFLFSCETKYNYIDTGLAKEQFEGTTWEYLQSNHYDWDSVVVMIERAGMEELFKGGEEGYKEFTFFGPTNLSILRWMIRNDYKQIANIPVEMCQDFIRRHVVAGVHYRDEIPRGEALLGQVQGNGGEVMKAMAGNRFWIYTEQKPYENIPNVGPVFIYIRSLDMQTSIEVASSNIKTYTGVVHSLDYSYTLGEL